MADENLYAPPEADVAVSDTNELAGRWLRLGGAIIDGIILMLVVWPVAFLTGFFARSMAGEQGVMDIVLIALLGVGTFLLLNGYLLAKSGQTIGKRLLNTQIVSKEDGSILPLGKVLGLRYLPVWVISQIPLVGPIFSLVDSLFVFRNDKRCIHDLIAGTVVINAPR